ncbi:MAG: glycine betaine ABC transporter substrate-binding protein, partial [Pseudomonadota bacterium]
PAFGATVIIGLPDWPSAQVTAHIIAEVIEEKLGEDARLMPVETTQIIGAIDRGEVDVHPEVWLPNSEAVVDEYQNVRGTLALSPLSVGASQHVCTTVETQEATGLQNLAQLAEPDIAAQFDTDHDGRGEIWIGARSWSSTRIERVRAKSYGYDQTMMLLTMPEDQALASVDAAVATGAPIVFYCYAPHFLFALHDIVTLAEPAHDPAAWTIVTADEDPAWLSLSKAPTAWQPARYHIGYAASLKEEAPSVAALLDRMQISGEDAEAMSYAVHVERRDPQEIAQTWVANNKTRIEEWVE